MKVWSSSRRLAAVCLALAVGGATVSLRSGLSLRSSDLGVLAALVAIAVLDVEWGRAAEGGRLVGQRPHKGLSGWPFCAVLLVASPVAALVAAPVYAYARWRGMRVPLVKWIGSCGIVVLSAEGAQLVLPSLADAGFATLASIALGALVYLVVEAAGFFGCALAGDPADEQWLKGQLRSREFYGSELGVLCQAAVLAVLWSAGPVLVLLALPSYAVLQRALLHAPLQEAAETDAKTGLLSWPAWEARARREVSARPFAVVLIDLDHFKDVNDAHGHLAGDAVLVACAERLSASLRPVDLLARFGGEEFCVLLPDTEVREAVVVAERMRLAVSLTSAPGLGDIAVTASFGVYAGPPSTPEGLREAVALADRALYVAKAEGRNCVRSHRPAVPVPTQRSDDTTTWVA